MQQQKIKEKVIYGYKFTTEVQNVAEISTEKIVLDTLQTSREDFQMRFDDLRVRRTASCQNNNCLTLLPLDARESTEWD